MDSQVMRIGNTLVELCRQGKNMEAVETLYAPNIVSIEPFGDETMPARMEGIEAIRGKNKWFFDNHEIHGAHLSNPWPNGDRFIVHSRYDITPTSGRMKGRRITVEEAALYTVKDGKIAQEEFFCDVSQMPG